MRSAGLLNFLYLRWFLRRHGLPAAPRRAAASTGSSAGSRACAATRRAFEDAVASGEATLVFLGRAGRAGSVRRARARCSAISFQPVFLVPVLLVWSRRAQKLVPSIWDVLYGSPEAPSAFANAIGVPAELPARVLRRGPAARPPVAPARPAARGRRGRGAQGPRRAPPAPRARVPHRRRAAAQGPLARPREGAPRPRRCAPPSSARRRGRGEAARGARRGGGAVPARDREPLRPRASSSSCGLLLARIFGRLYTSVEVDEEGLARVKRASADAPIVLCPSHKSHVDYLVLSLAPLRARHDAAARRGRDQPRLLAVRRHRAPRRRVLHPPQGEGGPDLHRRRCART